MTPGVARAWSLLAALATALALPASADSLRNLAPGEPLPGFALPTLDGAAFDRDRLAGRAAIILFVAAEQRRSIAAVAEARAIWRARGDDAVALLLVSADADRADWFRRLRDGVSPPAPPVAFDADRAFYGALGLIVLPTTIVLDREQRLDAVISSHRAGYGQALAAHVDHALGRLDDAGLAARLEASPTDDAPGPAAIVARHRATARVLIDSGAAPQAEAELDAAIEVDPLHVAARLDRAALLLRLGRATAARGDVDAALAVEPASRRGRLLLGAALFHAGELDEAERVLEVARQRNADHAWTHYYLGRIREARGDDAGAAARYRAALERLLDQRDP